MKRGALSLSKQNRAFVLVEIIIAVSLLLFFALIFFESYKTSVINKNNQDDIRSVKSVVEKAANYIKKSSPSEINNMEIDGYILDIQKIDTPYSYQKIICKISNEKGDITSFTYYKDVKDET